MDVVLIAAIVVLVAVSVLYLISWMNKNDRWKKVQDWQYLDLAIIIFVLILMLGFIMSLFLGLVSIIPVVGIQFALCIAAGAACGFCIDWTIEEYRRLYKS